MTVRRRSFIRFIGSCLSLTFVGIISLAVIGFGLILYLRLHRLESFPLIPVGAYLGKISGTNSDSSTAYTFYLERFRKDDSLLLIIFHEGWKPLFLNPEKTTAPPLWKSISSSSEVFKPLALQLDSANFLLVGGGRGQNYSGEVQSEGKIRGHWSLHSVSASELRQPSPLASNAINFTQWLEQLAQYSKLKRELDELSAIISEKRSLEQQLIALSEDPALLQKNTPAYKEQLTAQLKEVSRQNEAKNKEVQQLTGELDQLSRITRRGQAIELARRVAKREAKWYQANWQTGADLSSFEQSLATKMNVDLLKLRANVKKAAEIEALKIEIAEEKSKLLKAQATYEEKVKDSFNHQSARESQPSRPWWQKWDSVFGNK